jgi:biopolymer transport protein ExbD
MAHGEVEEGFGSRKIGLAPPNINVTPLIDVLLVLLIIFMVIQPKKEMKFESQVPQRSPELQNQQVENDPRLVVEVEAGGVGMDQYVALNTQRMRLTELGDRLKLELDRPERQEKAVIIKAPTDKAYGDVVSVIDAVKGAGAKPIGLQIDYLESGKPQGQ